MIVPKSEWGPGPWQDEPDRVEFKHHGFPCLLRRAPSGGWCGYVAVAPGHPWHGIEPRYDEAEVHGGVSFTGACSGEICHVPEPGEPDDVWWIGFDCNHYGDVGPADDAYWRSIGRPEFAVPGRHSSYKTVAYARAETERLAEQALGAGRREAP